jgi:hypothetical protein
MQFFLKVVPCRSLLCPSIAHPTNQSPPHSFMGQTKICGLFVGHATVLSDEKIKNLPYGTFIKPIQKTKF